MARVTLLTPYNGSTPTPGSAGERHVMNVARAIARRDWKVELCAYGPDPVRELLEPGLFRRVMRPDNRPACSADWLSWEMLGALEAADILHIYGPFTHGGSLATALGTARHLPICVTDFDYDSKRLGWELGAAELAAVVIAHSADGAARIPTRRPVETVSIGVDVDFFRLPPTARRAGVLLVGGVEPNTLPPGTHPAIAGGDELRLRRQYQGAQVTIIGATDRGIAADWLALSMLESMACGTPVMIVGEGALGEWVEDGRTGWFVASPAELRERLGALLAEPSLAVAAGHAAREWVEQTWNLDRFGSELVDIYRSLLG